MDSPEMATTRAFHQLAHRFGAMSCAREIFSEIGILGVPFRYGQRHAGAAKGPQGMRNAGLVKKLQSTGFLVEDYGDLTFEHIENDHPSNNVKHPRTVGDANLKIAESVRDIIDSGKICLSLGGDHSMSMGTVYGHARAEPDMTLIWVDAHPDINPPLASKSGHIHGMPLAFLVKELHGLIPKVAGLEWLSPCISAKDIAYIGLRDIDPAEKFIIEKYGITSYTIDDIDKYGIETVVEKVLKAINPNLDRPMHLSFDIDSLDPSISPSTGTPVSGGLTIQEGLYIAHELAQTGKLTALDLAEVNPELGSKKDQELTLLTATEIITACFDKQWRGDDPQGYVAEASNAL